MQRLAALVFGLGISVCFSGLLVAQTADNVGPVSDDLANPRATMRTFLTSIEGGNIERAATCFDWSDSAFTEEQRQELATQLKDVIDRMAWVNYANISAEPDADTYRFPPGNVDPPIEIIRQADGSWLFSAATVGRIENLHEAWKDRPLVVDGSPWHRQMTPLGMEVWRIIALFLCILIAWIVGRILRSILTSMSGKMERRNRHYVAVTLQALAKTAVPMALALGLKLGCDQFLVLNPSARTAVNSIVAILNVIAIAYVIWRLVDVVETWLNDAAEKTTSKLDEMLAPMIGGSMRVTIIVMVLVQIATIVSDKPPSAIIASLGVGGLAIGLAAQDTIKNFFGSLMIFSDRPFELGDRIDVGGFDGSVESVGFRSTRLRTLDGHLITVPNGELANQPIRNITKRPGIKRSTQLGLTYDTSPEKVQQAVTIVQGLLDNHEGQDPDSPAQVYLAEFGDSALLIQVVYWYHPADWKAYCEFNHRLHLEILTAFNDAEIDFAFPTQTVHLAGSLP